MPFILLAGPEKAGKTTIARILQERHHATVRHWGPVAHDDEFLDPLRADLQLSVNTDKLIVWDRGWPCEWVYAHLLDRTDHRSYTAPWTGEWFYGRAVQAVGTTAVLLGESATDLAAHRDDTDLPVDPALERQAYLDYACACNYHAYENKRTTNYAVQLADKLAEDARTVHERAIKYGGEVPVQPPQWAGQINAPIVFVGEALSKNPGMRGAWLPMTSRYGTQLAEALGFLVTRCAWTNVEADLARLVLRSPHAAALGQRASAWLASIGHPRVHHFPHPSAIYRWGRYGTAREQYGRRIADFVKGILEAEGGNAAQPHGEGALKALAGYGIH